MSHLPLDARAILEYLNELGYRNITAAQLKEFMKGMQPHSEVPSTTTTTTKTSASASARNSFTPNPKTTANTNNINVKSPNRCKLVKGKKPLINFKFYLDIKDHQILKKVEERITELGGTLEFFLTKSVTHFVTDRSPAGSHTRREHQQQQNNSNNLNNSQNGIIVKNQLTGGGVSGGGVGGGGGAVGIGYPITPSPYIQSPQTPATPQTPYTNQTYSGDSATDGVVSSHSRLGGVVGVATTPNHKKKNSRADAMLHRALHSQQQTQQSANPTFAGIPPPEEENRPHLEQDSYAVWHLDYAIRFLKKVTADLKQYIKKTHQPVKGACEPILLKGHFIKIETVKRHSRPYYSVFRKIEWPKVHFKEDGAFRLTPKDDECKSAKDKPSKTNAMTRKSRSSSKHNHNHMRLKAKQAPKQTEKPAVAVDNTSDKQCGVCEICKIEYDTLTIHLKTKDHEFFARNQSNYLALDTLIKSSANVDKFLDENAKIDPKQEPLETMEVDEEVTRQTRQSSRIQTPPPPLKIKTKLKEVESQGAPTTENKPTHNNVRKPVKSAAPLDSPPIRHPLPNSTIYKVVEDNKARTEPATPQTSSIIVKFRKIRQTELSILNGEAENFMFPKRPASSECTDSDRQTSTDSNRISSSSISSESHSVDDHVPGGERADSAASKRRRIAATGSSSRKSTTTSTTKTSTTTTTTTTTVASVCYQSFPNTPIQPNRTSRTTRELREANSRNSVTPKPTAQRRRRNCLGGRRRRRRTSRSRRQQERERRQRCASEDRMGDHGNEEDDDGEEEKIGTDLKEENLDESIEGGKKESRKKKLSLPPYDINQGRVKDQKYAFERLPVKELWFEVFHRQDACQERMFEYWGSTTYRKLPYEMGAIPIRTLACCKICTPTPVEVKKEPKDVKDTPAAAPPKGVEKLKKIKKEKNDRRSSKNSTPEPDKANKSKPRIRNKLLNKATFLSYDLMPRKSPREHASTLAILSCLIKQRQDSEIDEVPPQPPPPPPPPPPPEPSPKEKTPEKASTPKRKTPSPVVSNSRISTPEPLQFVSEISENVKRLRRGQRKFEDFVPSKPVICPVNKKKPRKPKPGLEFELDEKRLKSLEAKQKSSVQLEHEIDAYLGRIAMKTLRLTPSPPPTESSGFVDDFSSDINLIDLIDCYDGGGGTGDAAHAEGDEENIVDQPVHRPASSSVFNFFSVHNRRRKNNKINKTGWPKKRRNIASTRQNHLLLKNEPFRFFCDYPTRQKNRLLDGSGLVTTSMTPPDTDLDEKYDCPRNPDPPAEVSALTPVPGEGAILCKEEILNNGYMSPSEKADNSDIFTVSSDGLDTDLDISSSQIKTEDIDDECTTSSTIAAPPATPEPAKLNSSPRTTPLSKNKLPSMAISNIMKKEVKVSCKRLRTPFRRFRQRR